MICTDRLSCEPLAVGHVAEMMDVLADPLIYEFLPMAAPESLAALTATYERQAVGRNGAGTEVWLNWILRRREDGAAIGYYQATITGDVASIGFVLHSRFWGQGYAVEAGAAVLAVLGGDYAVTQVQAEIHPDNARSKLLVARLGFVFERYDAAEGDDIFVWKIQ